MGRAPLKRRALGSTDAIGTHFFRMTIRGKDWAISLVSVFESQRCDGPEVIFQYAQFYGVRFQKDGNHRKFNYTSREGRV